MGHTANTVSDGHVIGQEQGKGEKKGAIIGNWNDGRGSGRGWEGGLGTREVEAGHAAGADRGSPSGRGMGGELPRWASSVGSAPLRPQGCSSCCAHVTRACLLH